MTGRAALPLRPVNTLFIANRGEIALRILRSARRMGLRTVIAASDVDMSSSPAAEADEVIPLGGTTSSESYLNTEKIIEAATVAGADAVHPGYGFLSENAGFARAVADAGMVFVGPRPHTLTVMGDKLSARAAATEAGLPIVPGGEADSVGAAEQIARRIGFPLLIKAVAGGGGRGMKRVDRAKDLPAVISLAASEARSAFGDGRVYVEKLIERGRHVEVQVLGDEHRAIHLGTRDCSVQRRFQKLLEEAPAPGIPDARRRMIEDASVALANHLAYRSAGTVEFLVDTATFDFYFLEMNARIQVEHPVTEAVTGVDLIEQQLTIADGGALGLRQEDVDVQGAAIELRINAEDPDRDFRPSPGFVTKAAWPTGAGVRVDSHIRSGDSIPATYDSLIGKLIVHAGTRNEAVERSRKALQALDLKGVMTTASLHARILTDVRFRQGGVDTRYLEELGDG